MRLATARNLGLWLAFLVALRLLVIPAEESELLEASELRAAVERSAGWIQRVQRPAGDYLYHYDAERDEDLGGYNEVRHAGVTLALFQAAGRSGDPQALAQGERGVQWMLDHLHREGDWAALTNVAGTRAKVGASALMVVGLAEQRLATGETRHDDVMRELGRFMVFMQRPDGGFNIAWDVGPARADTVGVSQYYPGEALWALALLHEAFPGEGWDTYARKTSRFVTTLRDDVEGVRLQPLADHWAAYALAEMAEWGLRDFEIEYARRLAGRFGLLLRTDAQRANGLFGGLLGIVRGPDIPAAAVGTWVEGLAAIWRLSASDERLADLRPEIEERLHAGASLLAARQTDEQDAAAYPRPERALGSWLVDGETRMDDQQHALSGLLYAADALDGRVQRAPGTLSGTRSGAGEGSP